MSKILPLIGSFIILITLKANAVESISQVVLPAKDGASSIPDPTTDQVTTTTSLSKYAIKVGTFIEIPSSGILFSVGEGRSDIEAIDKRIEYSPSATTVFGINLSVLDFSVSWKSDMFTKDSDRARKYGKSKFDDFVFGYSFGYWAIRIFYQKTNGYYTDLNALSGGISIDSGLASTDQNSNDNTTEETTIRDELIVKRADMKSINWGASLGIDFPLIDITSTGTSLATDLAIEESLPKTEISSGFNFGVHALANLDFAYFALEGSGALVDESKRAAFGDKLATLTGIAYQRLGVEVGLLCPINFGERFGIFFSGLLGNGLQRSGRVFSNKSDSDFGKSEHFKFTLGST
ncbi:MAG: hypothetical protein A2504_11410 [Bdellovibrionales bacterium RIFOXYD12_FULL_39_22]|nr:MAG: hypothetical protein A2385_09975 [Bdellovibrionales bacterium RIFOXYB1_FULL_39_21]OFZ44279.1 MAG: hypothetical protein A2485_07595 [Bdellovibrionales bacterium RIFOXYC12_FULL_39_17]OFZ46821.1 MAG: hypothetical protein A2404_04830 [Bdellovibrionales bacterium RIFOXYC1_FULL_39_130]OFZ75902.1 MAG: hypothetical protein A2560_02320 [Bdellovibrionales bacterium RIFOXYD1_FULL_39_84]OFZ95500.1 MAG: hypothetical protein A2504_11410 [Bdellovibrionales bacterium RIFOXYD12_FULL_39_22]HLE09761.1 hy